MQSDGDVQSFLQSVVPHVYGAHEVGVGVPQAPAPLQRASLIAMSPVQLGSLQVVSAPGNALHAVRSEPSHLPVQTPVPEHAVRVPCGAPTTAVQVPTLPPISQASHCPEHAVLQQTPSAQTPEPHSALVVHPVASGLEQDPAPLALHFSGAAQDGVEQQTPSTQLPEAHWDGAVHTVPSAPVVMHTPLLQK